jgi:hypothetical protein
VHLGRAGAADEGVARFDAVDQALLDEELERAIDRGRLGAAAVGAQGLQELKGADRGMALPDQFQHPPADIGQPRAALTAQRLRRTQRLGDAMLVIMGDGFHVGDRSHSPCLISKSRI